MIRRLVFRNFSLLLSLGLLSGCAWFIGLEKPTRAEASGGSAGIASGGARVEGGSAGSATGGTVTSEGGAAGSGGATVAALCGSQGDHCSGDMVLAPTMSGGCVCIDRYEASKDGSRARSVAGAEVWNLVTLGDASAACGAVDKRLCSESEWRGACSFAGARRYPYGNDYDKSACVTQDNGGPTMASEAGSDPDCEGGREGLFDMLGNVAEWTQEPDAETGSVRGGSYASQDSPDCDWVQKSYGADTQLPFIGFRCCAEPMVAD